MRRAAPYLGVSRLPTRGDYAAAVESTPTDVHPTRRQRSGLGDEATLLSGAGGLRYLVARKGESGVVLFPLGGGTALPDDQLRALAERALSRAG